MDGLCRKLLILGIFFYIIIILFSNDFLRICPSSDFFSPLLRRASLESISNISSSSNTSSQSSTSTTNRTNLSHLVFGLLGSEKAWHHRKGYIESWWRPNVTRGFLYLDQDPTGELLPWSENSPPYRISEDLTGLLNKSEIRAQRMVHGIMEVFRQDHENLRWLIMGDDDSIFFVDNMVDVLSRYDHTRYYYLGGHSEFILSNYFFSFNQAFGGGGIMLSYPLAKALATNMEDCLKRYAYLNSADNTTRACIADIGVELTAQRGSHQVDLVGDISGFLSSHPQTPLLSLHHFDVADPIFPYVDRVEATRRLMRAANADQSRMLQQTICHHREANWTFSVSWGYSAHIYEKIMPRSWLQYPIETFKTWIHTPRPPNYLFNTRARSPDPCEAPHFFFFESVERNKKNEIVTVYNRGWERPLPACLSSGNHSADSMSRIVVVSPPTKRIEMDRCECCDVLRVNDTQAEIKFRECREGEVVA